jgi:AcrR family transcriptional regulator
VWTNFVKRIIVLIGMETKRAAVKPIVKRGRPREFDENCALDAAMKLFWQKGYEGTSLPDLTKAMRINRPSLYAAFGDKKSLFRKALDRYVEGPASFRYGALAAPTAREVGEKLLIGAAISLTDPRTPHGCLAVQGALACGDDADCIRQELATRRAAGETQLRKRFERAVNEGDLPKSANPADLARYITTVMFGMAVQASGGATRAQLKRTAEIAMQVWPR